MSPGRRGARAAAVPLVALALVVALPACGGDGDDGRRVLAETAQKLSTIRSGRLDASLLVRPRSGEPFGWTIAGPFELPARRGALPRMRVRYTQIANGRRAGVTLVSDGRDAHAEANGERVPLTAEQVAQLRSVGDSLGGEGGAALPLDDWIVDPKQADGGEVGGAATDEVRGRLDVAAAARTLLGAGGRNLPDESAKQLRDATRDSSFAVWTGKDDRLLRRLELRARLGLDVPRELRRALGDVVGATITFRLGVGAPNEPVDLGG